MRVLLWPGPAYWGTVVVGNAGTGGGRSVIAVEVALETAARTRGVSLDRAIFRSDNEAPYASKEFAKGCRRLGVTTAGRTSSTSSTRSSTAASPPDERMPISPPKNLYANRTTFT
ncbi:hypothetical protein ACQF4J_00420 [Streptomyces sp. C1-1]|uniref:hypothetical protein n=1 Tax=Streptomyces sp. C1-1 TaxID=3231173 RepID=UPI003CFF422B